MPKDNGHDLTNQPPEESEVPPSKTTSLGGKRSWATDTDSDGQVDPKRTSIDPNQPKSPPRVPPLPNSLLKSQNTLPEPLALEAKGPGPQILTRMDRLTSKRLLPKAKGRHGGTPTIKR